MHVPYLFRIYISNPYQVGEEPTLDLGKCAWLSHCPNAHQRCIPMLTCLIGAAARAIPAVNVAKCSTPSSHRPKRSVTKAASELQGLVAKVQDTNLRLGSQAPPR